MGSHTRRQDGRETESSGDRKREKGASCVVVGAKSSTRARGPESPPRGSLDQEGPSRFLGHKGPAGRRVDGENIVRYCVGKVSPAKGAPLVIRCEQAQVFHADVRARRPVGQEGHFRRFATEAVDGLAGAEPVQAGGCAGRSAQDACFETGCAERSAQDACLETGSAE